MPFNWYDFYRLSIFLNSPLPSIVSFREAALRTATSRAYFAAYGAATEFAKSKLGFTSSRFDPSEDHKKLREWFQGSGKDLLARKLQKLRMWRNDSDYKKVIDDPQWLAKGAIRLCSDLFRELNSSWPDRRGS